MSSTRCVVRKLTHVSQQRGEGHEIGTANSARGKGGRRVAWCGAVDAKIEKEMRSLFTQLETVDINNLAS